MWNSDVLLYIEVEELLIYIIFNQSFKCILYSVNVSAKKKLFFEYNILFPRHL